MPTKKCAAAGRNRNMDSIAMIFLSVGILFLLIAVMFFAFQKNREKTCTEKTVGEVVGIKESHCKGRTAYSPVFSFRVNGAEVRAHLKIFRNPLNVNIGDSVPILYDKNDPERIIMADDKAGRLLYILFGGLGAVMLLIGLVFGALL